MPQEEVVRVRLPSTRDGEIFGVADLLLGNLPPGMTWEQAMEWVLGVIKQHVSLKAAIASLEQEEAKARETAGKAQKLKGLYMQEASDARRDFNKLDAEATDLLSKFCDLANEYEKLEKERANLEKACADLTAEQTRIKAAGGR